MIEALVALILWVQIPPPDPLVTYVEMREFNLAGGCKVTMDAGGKTYEHVQPTYVESYEEVVACLGRPLSIAQFTFDLKEKR